MMSIPRPLSLLAALVLLSPLAAAAVPACGPGQHCPMAGLLVDEPPCHGATIQADDCCLTAATVVPADVVPMIGAMALAVGDAAPAPRLDTANGRSATASVDPPSTPLYRLFRTLLI